MGQLAGRRFFGAIQLGRWAAAFAVMCFHAGQSVTAFVGEAPFGIDRVFKPGFLGVDFFFVLSGFIIYHVHSGDGRTVDGFLRFGRRRLARIYLPYLPIALALMIAYTLMPTLSAGGREWSLVKTLTLLPIQGDTALTVAWTLIHEVVFYAIFGILFYGRMIVTGSAIWAAMIVSFNVLSPSIEGVHGVAFHFLNLEFLLGVAAAHVMRYLPSEAGGASIRIGAIIAAPILFLAPDGPERVAFGVGMAFIILGLAIRERDGTLRVPAIAKPLGDASYALYLIHIPLLSLTARAGALVGAGWVLTFILSAAACCAAAAIYHLVIERPLIALVHRGAAEPNRVGGTAPG